MEKVLSDHLIKQYGFIPLEFEGFFLGDDNRSLDHFEWQLFKTKKPVKIMGYVPGDCCRVILDTRKVDFVPFAYIYSFVDKFHMDVRNAIWADEKARRIEAERLRNEREQALSSPGKRVHVLQRYGRDGFTASNGTVLSRQFGEATVRLDYGIEVTVLLSQLTEPKENQKMLTLRGELNSLYGRFEVAREKDRAMIQTRIDSTIKQIEDLELQPV